MGVMSAGARAGTASIPGRGDTVRLTHGEVLVEVRLAPFSFSVRRRGVTSVRAGEAWLAEGVARDVLLQFTEGVVPIEERSAPRRVIHARVLERRAERRDVLAAAPGPEHRHARHRRVRATGGSRCAWTPTARRCGSVWAGSAPRDERLCGLGPAPPAAPRSGRPGHPARRRPPLPGPDCPEEMIEEGGIPQGDCAPVPWLLSSRGYGVWCRTAANGTRFDLAGERVEISTRAHAGALELELLCASTPAAALRGLCRLTGWPALLPEWGYGFWKSRDVHEHQDDVLDDFLGFRRHHIPLDAVVIDSPWATQYNTWEFNPHQFPDARWMISAMRASGVRTVVWVTPWVNLDSRDGQIAPQPESERAAGLPASNYAPGAAAGHFVREPRSGAPRTAAASRTSRSGGWGPARRSTSRARPRRRGGVSRPSGCSHSASPASRPTTATATTSRTGSGWRTGARGAKRRGSSARCTAAACSARWTRSIPGRGCCSAAAAGAASTPTATPGAATRSRTSGRCGCSWSRCCPAR